MNNSTPEKSNPFRLRSDILISCGYLLLWLLGLLWARASVDNETSIMIDSISIGVWHAARIGFAVIGFLAVVAAFIHIVETLSPNMNNVQRLVFSIVVAAIQGIVLIWQLGTVISAILWAGAILVILVWWTDDRRKKPGQQIRANYNDNTPPLRFESVLWIFLAMSFFGAMVIIIGSTSDKPELFLVDKWQLLAWSIFTGLWACGILLVWHHVLTGWYQWSIDNTIMMRVLIPVVLAFSFYLVLAGVLLVSDGIAAFVAVLLGGSMLVVTFWDVVATRLNIETTHSRLE